MPNHGGKRPGAGRPKGKTKRRRKAVYTVQEALRWMPKVQRGDPLRQRRRVVFVMASLGIGPDEIAAVLEIAETELSEQFRPEIKMGLVALRLGLGKCLRARALGRGGLRPHVGAIRFIQQDLNRLDRLDGRQTSKRVTR